jgi:MFS transporter, PAT family, beta-lactamase induction signal transducer AmpG
VNYAILKKENIERRRMRTNKLLNLTVKDKNVHPGVFMVLISPFGVVFGFVSVTLAYMFSKAGISLDEVAALVAASLLPNILKFLWAPLVDTTLSNKKWYLISVLVSAVGIVLISLMPIKEESLTLLTVLVFLTNFAVTFLGMSTDSMMAYDTPSDMKGRAGGWMQTGSLGGMGIGGGIGLFLAERLPANWMAGTILAFACLFSSIGLLFLSEPQSTIRVFSMRQSIKNMNKDIISVMKSKVGFIALFLCFLPIGSGAASNLWSALASEWSASSNTVSLVIGTAGGIIAALGCLLGGWICDRMDRRYAYIAFGLVQAICAVGMGLSPRTETMYIIWTSLYAVSTGLTYAGFTAFVLDAMGTGAAATKYNIFASLSNAPIYFMIFIDGWAHEHWNSTGMLNVEAAIGIVGMLLFIIVIFFVNRMKYFKVEVQEATA